MNQQILYQPQTVSVVERINSPVKIVQCIQALNEQEFIGLTLRSIYDEVDKILCIEGAVKNQPNSTPDGHSTDNTVEIIQDFKKNHDPQRKLLFLQIKRHFESLEELKQTFLDLSYPGEIILINDVDECYQPEDIRRIRRFFDLQPHATELIPTFIHFYGDFWHIAVPGSEWSCSHQRVVKLSQGVKYLSHPVLTDISNRCTYFSPEYQHRRFVPNPPVYIWHYGYARQNMDQRMQNKKLYYEQELAKHDGADKKFDKKMLAWFNKSEPVLEYDGPHPEIMKQHPLYGFRRNDLNVVGNWRENEFYKKVLSGEPTGNIPLCMNKQAQPYMNFYHNGIQL